MFLYYLSEIITVLMCLVIFYVIAIRPGRDTEKRRYAAVQKITPGDIVVLESGLIGKVIKREDVLFYVKLSEGFIVQVLESGIKDIVDILKISNNTKETQDKIEEAEKLDLTDNETALPSIIVHEPEPEKGLRDKIEETLVNHGLKQN